jgi:ankyrin repeat protein
LNLGAQDKDGRTPLSIAASEGNIDAVKYLIKYESNMAIRDARNNDALSDARRESRANVVSYLSSIISEEVIHQHCDDFADGLFRKGVQQAIGNFHKRFADLAIKVSSTSNYGSLLTLLGAPKSSTKDYMV